MVSKSSIVVTLVWVANIQGQSAVSKAETALDVLQAWYNETSGIWNTCGWWNGANCMTAIADLAKIDSSILDTATEVFENTWINAPSVNPGQGVEKAVVDGRPETIYPNSWPHAQTANRGQQGQVNASLWLDGAYDDDAWWALAWIAASDVTGNQDYLDLAAGIFEDLAGVWPTTCGNGGIYWTSERTYVNAIANELFLSLAAHLSNRVPDQKQYYLEWAQNEWTWFSTSGMINSNYTINDGLTTACTNNGQTEWSYNQGVILGGLAEMYRADNNQSYLDEAAKIAQAAINLLADEQLVIHESCEPDDCNADQTQFKGIFIRNLLLLQSVAPNDLYVQVIDANAASIWASDRNSANQFGVDWSELVTGVTASTHSSAMDALVANVVY
ncbi:glycoside hydrolase [Xylogone sp. PMI_703]|nr:glycoside hydrolase [Xylogone sp. PMI_703]